MTGRRLSKINKIAADREAALANQKKKKHSENDGQEENTNDITLKDDDWKSLEVSGIDMASLFQDGMFGFNGLGGYSVSMRTMGIKVEFKCQR